MAPELLLPQPEIVPKAPIAAAASTNSNGLCSKLLRRRVRPNIASSEPGSNNAKLVCRSLGWCPGNAGIDRAASEPVPIVSVLVTAFPASVTVAGLKEHVSFDGSVPQLGVSVPVKPPIGVKVSVVMPVAPRAMVTLEGAAVTVKPGTATVILRAEDVLLAKLVSPA